MSIISTSLTVLGQPSPQFHVEAWLPFRNCEMDYLSLLFIVYVIVGYDCPPFEDIFPCVSMIAGGTLMAAQKLVDEECSVAINWQGGWHHSQRYTIIARGEERVGELRVMGKGMQLLQGGWEGGWWGLGQETH